MLIFISAITLSLVAGSVAQASDAKAAESPQIKLDSGTIEGRAKDDLHIFQGIPYVAPPINDLRWKPPQPVTPWPDTLETKSYGCQCPQKNQFAPNQDEDCLYLNIWAPAKRSTKPSPVMVWIHGGGFVSGDGQCAGENFAKHGIVFVSFNYRLGRLGSFAHPALLKEKSEQQGATNFWLLDQIAALKWVQRNIARFGGDPHRVTIFGVSAGGASVAALMASPLSMGLFHGAIAQSPPGGYGPFRHSTTAHKFWEPQTEIGIRFAKSKGITNQNDAAKALRELSWPEAAKLESTLDGSDGIGLIVDGVTLVEDLQTTFANGRQHDVPFIAGVNSFEGSVSVFFPWRDRPPKPQLEARLQQLAPLYDRLPTDSGLMLDLYGDVFFRAGTLHIVTGMQQVSSPAWTYHFDYVYESLSGQLAGAAHGSEVPYVFNDLPQEPYKPGFLMATFLGIENKAYVVSQKDRAMANLIQQQWIQFAKTGTPNGKGLPNWPTYTVKNPITLVYGQKDIEAHTKFDHLKLETLKGLLDQAWLE